GASRSHTKKMENKQTTPVLAENGSNYDREEAKRAFDETKTGVKGLVDAGVQKLPEIFVIEETQVISPVQTVPAEFEIPVIDIGGINGDPVQRKRIVQEIRNASETWGFFQIVNHGVPSHVMEEMVEGVRNFNEEADEAKMEYYSRDEAKKVRYNSNYHLHRTKYVYWRDSLFFSIAPDPPKPEEFPVSCREITIEYSKHVQRLGLTLFELLSEALGLKADHFNEMECSKGLNMLCHYYPACPEPNRTLGAYAHKDPSFITILQQDHIGGLQVLYKNQWIDVPPVPGAFVVNIGDLLQLVSNEKFKSATHRVLANQIGPRISVASFFSAQFPANDRFYGPIKELLSAENPPLYRDIKLIEYASHFLSVVANDNTTPLDHFRL
ncbi:hypothetical protein Tsubulata_033426, partial [Turnera subulata]